MHFDKCWVQWISSFFFPSFLSCFFFRGDVIAVHSNIASSQSLFLFIAFERSVIFFSFLKFKCGLFFVIIIVSWSGVRARSESAAFIHCLLDLDVGTIRV